MVVGGAGGRQSGCHGCVQTSVPFYRPCIRPLAIIWNFKSLTHHNKPNGSCFRQFIERYFIYYNLTFLPSFSLTFKLCHMTHVT